MEIWNPVVFDFVFWGLKCKLHLFASLAMFSALAMYPFYIVAVMRGMRPPLSTWVLWSVLDIIAFGSRLNNGTFDAQLFAFMFGTTVTSLFILKYGKNGWTITETACVSVVIVAITAWAVSGPFIATICSMIGLTVAMVPLLIRVLQGEYEDLYTWCISLGSSVFNLLDGKILTSIWFMICQATVVIVVVYHLKYPSIKSRK